jgi:hypothetical protein
MVLQEQPCPECGHKRTVRLGTRVGVCFNCRSHWVVDGRARPIGCYRFSGEELNRLERYRKAVAAGFYSDWPVGPHAGAPVRPSGSDIPPAVGPFAWRPDQVLLLFQEKII